MKINNDLIERNLGCIMLLCRKHHKADKEYQGSSTSDLIKKTPGKNPKI